MRAIYLTARSGGTSNVDEMIVDIAKLQTERERLASEPCEPSWGLPTLTAAEAFSRIDNAITEVVFEAALSRHRHRNGDTFEALFQSPPSVAVNCSTGTGKTEAMVSRIATFLFLDTTARVVIAVPTHKLGQGLADRINSAYGSEVAAEWYGTDHPDPQEPGEKMCRLAEAAKELVSLGGKLQLLCSRRREHMEYCQHHPAVAGDKGCGYQRQQILEARNKTRVWIIPATMLAAAPPVALKRPKHGSEGDFDLLVIDEAPWFSLLPDEPAKLPIEWLSPEWWAAQDKHATEVQKGCAIETLAKLSETLIRLPLGEVSADEFRIVGIAASDLSSTRRTIWKFKIDLRHLVKPGWRRSRLKKALATVAPHNQRVVAVAEALYTVMLHVGGALAPSGVELTEEGGRRYLCLRRKQDIDPAWLKAPTLYLDAADIGSFEIARAWLPNLDLKVGAKAKAPNMRVTQLVDSQMAYRRLVARGNDKEPTAENNQDKLADLITSRGSDGLVIGPKKLRLAWEKANRLPPGWMVWNFGGIRGRDEAREVPRLVIVSRPLPSPAEVEIMAETIFGRRVRRLPAGAWYPKAQVGRLMADGTGRRTLALRHPDPFAEAVRFAVCEGELLQAVGRGRGVRRSGEMPLDVLILTDVPLPMPVNELTTWRALTDSSGPLGLLAARGIVPLDYNGIAAALPEWFASAAKVKDWFQYRPEARLKLKAIQWMAREGAVDLCEFSGISHRESNMEDSAKLAAYRYRRPRSHQSSIVLVNGEMHPDARAAVEAVLGSLGDFRPVESARPRRPRRQVSSTEPLSQSVLDQLFGRSGSENA
jgi:putative DNA primase/helicase